MNSAERLNSLWICGDPEKHPELQKIPVSWFCADNGENPRMAVFRKTFELDKLPADAVLECSGTTKFRLFINGQFVTDGPVEPGGDYADKSAPDWWFADRIPVGKFLQAKRNVIVVEMITHPEDMTNYSTGVCAWSCILLADGETVLTSGTDWKFFINPNYLDRLYTCHSRFRENYHCSSFADSSWENAVGLPAEKSRAWTLSFLDLPQLEDCEVLPSEVVVPFAEHAAMISGADILTAPDGSNAMIIRPGIPVTFYLRFPRMLTANAEFEVEAHDGAHIYIEPQECPEFSGMIRREAAHHELRNGRMVYRQTNLEGFRFLKVSVICSTYRADPRNFLPLKIYSIKAQERCFPLGKAAKFESSDPGLSLIRQACDYSLRNCILRQMIDSPVHLEGGGIQLDYQVIAHSCYAMYGDLRPGKAELFRTANYLTMTEGFQFHTSYSLYYIKMAEEYLQYSGDFDTIKAIYPAIRMILERFHGYTGETGLISEAPNYMFIDWIQSGDVSYHHPPAARGMGFFTALYSLALECAEKFAEMIMPQDAELFRTRRAAAAAAFESLWRAEKGCYCEGIIGLSKTPKSLRLPPDGTEEFFSPQVNFMALAAGIVPKERISGLLDKLFNGKWEFQMNLLLHGIIYDALDRCRAFAQYGFATFDIFRRAVAENPYGIKEAWQGGDYCHAGSSSPVWAIAEFILGVRPCGPGFSRVKIAPCPGDLSFFEGEVPTPSGNIEVVWRDGTFDYTLPSGMEYVIDSEYQINIHYKESK
ncbi:MAG: hypothetical protein E7058_09125 [Lentisphaerae bacterium]|nr:hypothetical protein [Lentisphaerota bacterium]